MELIHYSAPYKTIATRAKERVQEVAEDVGATIEVVESETNGMSPEAYFEGAFLQPMNRLYEEHSGETEADGFVRNSLKELKIYIEEGLEEAKTLIVELHKEYVSIIRELSLVEGQPSVDKLIFYANKPSSTFCFMSSCTDVMFSLDYFINNNKYNDDKLTKFIIKFKGELID